MRFKRISALLRVILSLGILITSCANAWAASNSCTYPKSGTGMGGTGHSGTGMGGTGVVAKGTGIGGTGIRPETAIDELRVAGKVILSQGSVEAQSYGRSRLLAKGDPVCVGETIVTSQSGTVQIRMADEGLISIRPQTQLKIAKFLYSGTNRDSSLFALLNGTCRIITGKIGKQYPQNDLIKTPTGLIGVLGTDHEATVILSSGSRGYPSGTYDKVNTGITFIRTEKGEVDIHPNQVGFAAKPGELPTLLKDMPDFYSTNASLRQEDSPSPSEVGNKEEDSINKVDQSMEPSGERVEFAHPAETETPSIESPDIPHDMEHPESPVLIELPERSDQLDR